MKTAALVLLFAMLIVIAMMTKPLPDTTVFLRPRPVSQPAVNYNAHPETISTDRFVHHLPR
jgi:hypothetical protein